MSGRAVTLSCGKCMMQAKFESYPLKHLMVLTAKGTVDLEKSKAAMKRLAATPDFDWRSEALLAA